MLLRWIYCSALVVAFGVGWLWCDARWEARYAQSEQDQIERTLQVERGWQAALQTVQADAAAALGSHATDLTVAADVDKRLQHEIAHPRVTADTAPACRSTSASSALILYSELLDRANQRAGELAAEADRRRIAGLACEQAYDVLR